jgi:methylphosphotriester-DNA--protein-cysteine methyltransferase
MIRHLELGVTHEERKAKIGPLIRSRQIAFGGYRKAKIYGTLTCSAGKRMKLENRVFFKDEQEGLELGYRPCGHCMPEEYKLWKAKKTSAGRPAN